jgi:hypothetical protein
MVSNTVMNILSTTTLFLANNTGTLAGFYGENEIDSIMSAWATWNSDLEKKVFSGTTKGRAISAGYSELFKGFVEMFGSVMWSEGVWDSLNDEVYHRFITALVNESNFVDSVKGLVKSSVSVRSGGAKVPSNRNKSAYLYCCTHFRAGIKEANPEFTPQQVTKALGEKWKAIQAGEDDETKALFMQFTETARLDKERYEKEHPKPVKVAKPRSPPKSPKRKGPPRGKSAWVIFCDIKRADVKEELGVGATNKDVMHKLGEMWASEDYTQIKIVAEKRSIEDKQRVKDLNAAATPLNDEEAVLVNEVAVEIEVKEEIEGEVEGDFETPTKPVIEHAPIKKKKKLSTISEDTVTSVTKKLDMLMSNLDDDDDDLLIEE